ncbi:MAG: hypothetical protein H5U11_11125 [Rhizobium sp.]|nr:hypothetical protein [Rhizobium sp.]
MEANLSFRIAETFSDGTGGPGKATLAYATFPSRFARQIFPAGCQVEADGCYGSGGTGRKTRPALAIVARMQWRRDRRFLRLGNVLGKTQCTAIAVPQSKFRMNENAER